LEQPLHRDHVSAQTLFTIPADTDPAKRPSAACDGTDFHVGVHSSNSLPTAADNLQHLTIASSSEDKLILRE
jgi:hypothetical protein